jgi:S1-C subfamily serine protease
MGLLKLGLAALVGSVMTLMIVAGPSNIATAVRQAVQPAVASVPAELSALLGQAPRPVLPTGNGANVAAPAVGQAGTQQATQPAPQQTVAAQQAAATSLQQALGQTVSETTVRVYQDNRPSVVTVVSQAVAPGFRSEPQPNGTGSGFIIDSQGHILTNNHVIAQAERLEVTLSDGSTYPARLVGRDSRFDLAVIQADIPADKLRPVTLGDSNELQVGEQVVAIGNPYGLDGTVTTGIVSGRRPLVSAPNGDSVLVNAIQTDTSINPGNSGGPLLNARGEVIGVATMGLMPNGGQAGLNFAIPVNNAKLILNDLIANGTYRHPFVGIGTAEITQTVASQLRLPVTQGLLIQNVEQGTAAAQAGLRAGSQQQQAGARQITAGGDIITAIDGRPVARPEDFISYLELNKKAGESVTLTVIRDGQQRDVTLTLGERPASQMPTPQQQPRQQPGSRQQPSFPIPGGR